MHDFSSFGRDVSALIVQRAALSKMTGDTGDTGDKLKMSPSRSDNFVPGRQSALSPVENNWGQASSATGDTIPSSFQSVGKLSPVSPPPPVIFNEALQSWRDGYRKLRSVETIDEFAPHVWSAALDDAAAFLSAFGNQIARLGWRDVDVFGVHPLAPCTRVGCWGVAFLIQSGVVVAVTDGAATIKRPSGAMLTWRRHVNEAVPAWDVIGGAA